MFKKAAFFIITGLVLLGGVGCGGIHDLLIHANEITQLLGALSELGLSPI